MNNSQDFFFCAFLILPICSLFYSRKRTKKHDLNQFFQFISATNRKSFLQIFKEMYIFKSVFTCV